MLRESRLWKSFLRPLCPSRKLRESGSNGKVSCYKVWPYIEVITHLLTSWDIQVCLSRPLHMLQKRCICSESSSPLPKRDLQIRSLALLDTKREVVKTCMFPRNRTNRTHVSRTPKKAWVSNSSIATYLVRGPLGFGPIEFLMEWLVGGWTTQLKQIRENINLDHENDHFLR